MTARTLSEARSKDLLARHGVPFAREEVVVTADEAAVAAARLGFPVVVKLNGDGVAHKTERDLVRLDVGSADAARAAAADLLALATPADGHVDVIVAEQVRGARELIAGVVRDPQFGPAVMLGIGGVFAEAIGDVAFRLVPLGPHDAADLIDDLATQSLLGAWRGEPPLDRAALGRVLEALSALAHSNPLIVSIDVNPLIVSGGQPVAVDALVEVDE